MTRPKIIAEVAQGYEGRPDYARLFVRAAHKAGADAVKFQVVYADDTAEPGYQHYDFYRQLEMDVAVWAELRAMARDLGIGFVTDISGDRALRVVREIVPDGIKIHSSNFFNRALLRAAFDVADRVLVSMGGVTVDEVAALVDEVDGWGCRDRLTLLYGFQAEPTPVERTQLARLPELRRRFAGVELGFMDHAPGDSEGRLHISAMAMAMGVDVIEKHLTLDRFMEIEDYVSALEPAEFAHYVATLAHLAAAVGGADPTPTEAELAYRDKSVKKLITAREIPAGHALALDDIAFKRTPRIAPGEGFHDPARVIGRTTARPLEAGAPILEGDLA